LSPPGVTPRTSRISCSPSLRNCSPRAAEPCAKRNQVNHDGIELRKDQRSQPFIDESRQFLQYPNKIQSCYGSDQHNISNDAAEQKHHLPMLASCHRLRQHKTAQGQCSQFPLKSADLATKKFWAHTNRQKSDWNRCDPGANQVTGLVHGDRDCEPQEPPKDYRYVECDFQNVLNPNCPWKLYQMSTVKILISWDNISGDIPILRDFMEIRPIRTDDDHRSALAQIEAHWGAPEGSERGDKLEVLVALVESYEARRSMSRTISIRSMCSTMRSRSWATPKVSLPSFWARARARRKFWRAGGR